MPEKIEEFIVKSPRKCEPISDLNLSQFIVQKFTSQNPNKTAIIFPDENQELTYGQLHQNIQQYANGYLNYGMNNNDFVLLFGDNHLDYFLSELAVIYLGVVFAPIAPADGQYELINQIIEFNGTVLIIDRHRVENVLLPAMNNDKYGSVIKQLKTIVVMDLNDDSETIITTLSKHPMAPKSVISMKKISQYQSSKTLEKIPYFEKKNSDRLFILYTSGTTGKPKGVILTHQVIVTLIGANKPIFQDCRIIFCFPFGHISGATYPILFLCHGSDLILRKNFNIDEMLSSVEKYKAQVIGIALENCFEMSNEDYRLKYNLDSLRYVVFGGCKMPKERLEIIKNRYNVIMNEMYGSTELLSCSYNNGDHSKEPLGSAGPPSAYCEMKIVDLETGENLPANKSGEICFRGPQMFVGYLNNKEATDKVIDSKGWYHTGDLGYYDERGNLYIEDRIKELIKFRHWNISPAQLEEFLSQNPAVNGVCVVGVKHETDSQYPRAYVEIRPGHKITEQELINSLKDNLGFPKRLRAGVKFVKEFPRTSIGKIDRKKCRGWVANELLTEIVD